MDTVFGRVVVAKVRELRLWIRPRCGNAKTSA